MHGLRSEENSNADPKREKIERIKYLSVDMGKERRQGDDSMSLLI